jgi:LPS sulfotransferase NodH
MTIAEADVIQAVKDRSIYMVQTKAEHDASPATNTTADILYDSSGRTQSNFSSLYLEAQDVLAADLASEGKIASDAQKIRLYALLIADAHLKKVDPNWAAQAVSFYQESVTRSYASSGDKAMTGYGAAYNALFAKLTSVDNSPSSDIDDIIETRDSEEYPDEFRLSTLRSDFS